MRLLVTLFRLFAFFYFCFHTFFLYFVFFFFTQWIGRFSGTSQKKHLLNFLQHEMTREMHVLSAKNERTWGCTMGVFDIRTHTYKCGCWVFCFFGLTWDFAFFSNLQKNGFRTRIYKLSFVKELLGFLNFLIRRGVLTSMMLNIQKTTIQFRRKFSPLQKYPF